MDPKGKPDFADRFYAKVRRDRLARAGLELAQAGKKKEAQAALKEAERFDRELKRMG